MKNQARLVELKKEREKLNKRIQQFQEKDIVRSMTQKGKGNPIMGSSENE